MLANSVQIPLPSFKIFWATVKILLCNLCVPAGEMPSPTGWEAGPAWDDVAAVTRSPVCSQEGPALSPLQLHQSLLLAYAVLKP